MDPIRLVGPQPSPVTPVVPASPRRDGERRGEDERERRRREDPGPGAPPTAVGEDGHVDVLA